MAVETVVQLQLVLPIVVGIIVGIMEAYFVYEDENMTSGKDFLGDMWHGLLFAAIGVVIASNVPWVMINFIPESFQGFLLVDGNGNSIVMSAIITIIMLVKMVSSHAIKGISGAGFSEKFWHKLVIALLVGFAPYYILWLAPFLAPITSRFPPWLN
jgi:hypothetical protein